MAGGIMGGAGQSARRPAGGGAGAMLRQACALAAAALLLTGCVAAAVKGAKTAASETTVLSNQAAADAGDARAQYMVGKAKCCAIGPVDLTHNNDTATEYLCRSAAQGYAPAQYVLGLIYGGHPIVGFDPQQSAKLALAGAPKNLTYAFMWFSLGAASDADSAKALGVLVPQMTPAELAAGRGYLADWQRQPCRYKQVFPGV